MTCSKLLFKVTVRSALRTKRHKLFDGLYLFNKNTVRGFGDHHKIGSPSENQGNIPVVYASSSRTTDKFPPAANNPLGSCNAWFTGGKGVSVSRKGSMANYIPISPQGYLFDNVLDDSIARATFEPLSRLRNLLI